MTTRRSAGHASTPSSPSANGSPSTSSTPQASRRTATKIDAPPIAGSPFFPTPLEAILLAIYPGTLILGSLFSTLQPSSRNAPYIPHIQSYDPLLAPSYFAKKSNVLNVYFVKIGWFWTTLAFFLLIFSHSSLGRPLTLDLTKRRVQAIARYLTVTAVWIAVTQWCFGPPIIDRTYRWTGGQCEAIYGEGPEDQLKRAEMGAAQQALTHAACKAIGGQWKGGHDISGHVFLLILGSAMLWLELLPAVMRTEGLREARRVVTADGLIRSASIETEKPSREGEGRSKEMGIGLSAALGVAGLSWWMLLMTAAYFHTWFEKFTGFLVAFGAIYTVYFLPRAVPGLRKVLGMPGV
ncbi:inositol phospholipid synthesis and fat-storage-inducing TM-domain-containing protein [Neohortaea acidophila]|uniref:Acyl-coenzyme A diphosphatase SCS3 n=1 Tax=Neohortaea acidophila TaxID=245834 RepID=A0A6A6PVK8_9PEZI|nr:inositol phospholipid synthesis and fat-storage-inducing TM-domain-containing protein [Neohortaea acidophila]KAF2484170.1 inositol phospholipid synthesis and fat-storage-inducing TM-domain-containing protein [Neohortaea acidophila]